MIGPEIIVQTAMMAIKRKSMAGLRLHALGRGLQTKRQRAARAEEKAGGDCGMSPGQLSRDFLCKAIRARERELTEVITARELKDPPCQGSGSDRAPSLLRPR